MFACKMLEMLWLSSQTSPTSTPKFIYVTRSALFLEFRWILSCKIVYKHLNIENNVNLMKVHNSANAAMYFLIKYLPTYLPKDDGNFNTSKAIHGLSSSFITLLVYIVNFTLSSDI